MGQSQRKLNSCRNDTTVKTGPNTGFEFGWQYKCLKSSEHHKCHKILQTDRCLVFCFYVQSRKICFAFER